MTYLRRPLALGEWLWPSTKMATSITWLHYLGRVYGRQLIGTIFRIELRSQPPT